jgi:hypothetical protein
MVPHLILLIADGVSEPPTDCDDRHRVADGDDNASTVLPAPSSFQISGQLLWIAFLSWKYVSCPPQRQLNLGETRSLPVAVGFLGGNRLPER